MNTPDAPTSAKVRIVTDSACDLPADLAHRLGIEIVPLTIRIDGTDYVDRRDLTPVEFWQRVTSSPELPQTAAPAPGAFVEVFRRLVSGGAEAIIVVSLSGALSATIQSAELAAREVADTVPVTVVDSRTCTLGQGMVAVGCAHAANAGATADEVVALARDLSSRSVVWGVLDTLENLRKGGRIGGAKALLASALAIKPVIEVRDGVVEQAGKQRTRTKALAFLVERLAAEGEVDHLAVLHADCSDVDEFVAMLAPHHRGEIVVGDIGPVVGTHAGRGTIGITFQRRR